MRRHFTYILAVFMAISALFASCAKEGYQGGESSLMQSEIVAALDSDSLAVQQLAVEVASAMGIQDGGVGQPLGDRTVSEVIPIQLNGEAIRTAGYSPEAVPAFFAVNYAPGGYSIVSSAHGESSLWAFFPDGQFSLQKMAECPPLCLLMERAVEMSVVDPPRRGHKPREIGDEEDFPKFERYIYKYGPLQKTSANIGPLIPVVWGQEHPYNLLVAPYPAGCVATAVAQILIYYRKPANCNWHVMRHHHPMKWPRQDWPEAYTEISKIFYTLGQMLHMHYSMEGSGADSRRIPQVLRDLGFESGGAVVDMDESDLMSEIEACYPVIVTGYSHCTTRKRGFWPIEWEETEYSGGHAFVVDGKCKFRNKVSKIDVVTGEEVSSFYVYSELVHANLGWDSPAYNGYYNRNIFDTKKIPRSDTTRFGLSSGQDGVYQYNLTVVEGIRP